MNIWKNLEQEASRLEQTNLTQLFANEDRFKKFSLELEDLLFDYSKQKIDSQVKDKLLELAKQQDLKTWIDKLFSGEIVNISENRGAQHTLLRAKDKPEFITIELQKIKKISEKIIQGNWRSFSGERITDVVNIGVGGSDLGPKMVCHALKSVNKSHIKSHFVSSIDGEQLEKILRHLSPRHTLFIVSSKSWTTSDTMANFNTAKKWLFESERFKRSGLSESNMFKQHFIAITASPKNITEPFAKENILEFWDFIGGRFSLWSSIGFIIAVEFGFEVFEALLKGALSMDEHFQNTPFEKNMPVLMGLLEVWNVNFLKINNRAILPYSTSFAELPAYLTQLEMESLGKSVSQDGKKIEHQTGSFIFGEIGSNAQHAFYQLLHQGTQKVSMDFIALVEGVENSQMHKLALMNCLAQSKALAFGDKNKQQEKNYSGDKPSNTLLFKNLNANNLGMLLSLYEHKVFVQSVIWQINAFDQWGVELGKKIANTLLDETKTEFDSSTVGLLKYINR
jgi:glucose-6-phosphate isomerase